MEFKIPFSGRAHTYTDEEVAVVVDAMQNAVPLTQGRYLQEFQEKFCGYIGSDYAFAVNNATSALELSAQLCCFQSGDEVIIPAHTFTASAYPFLKSGAIPVWADIDLESRVVTAESLERCITDKTKAIVVVHLYGYGAEMPEIMALAERHNLLVIEDAAQALGVDVGDSKVGTFGDFGVFSFHSHKNMTTLGEGGMLTVKESRFSEILPMLRHNGHCGFDFERQDYWVPAMGNVDLPELDGERLWPNNYCLGEVESALGTKLLDRVDKLNEEKRRRALAVIDALSDCPELEFHRVDTTRHNYHLLSARVMDGKRDQFMRRMAYDEGVQCVVQYYPLNRYPLYVKSGFGEAECPNTDLYFDNMVSFPFHHMMSEQDLEYVVASCKKTIQALR